MSVKAKYIKDLPLKEVLDGSESLLVQDLNGTQQAPLEVIIDEIKQNSQEKIREIENKKADKDEIGKPTQEQVDNWLNNNPQATTTVQENSISPSKTTFVKTYNLFNKNNAKNGYTITVSGIVESSVPDDFVTEKIKLNTYVIVKGLTQGYYIYTHKSNGALTRLTISNASMSFNSKDVEYIEISGNYKDKLEIYQLGNYDIHKDGYIVSEYVNEPVFPNRTKNLFNYRKAMIGFRDSGGYLAPADKYFVSEFIKNEDFSKIYTNFKSRVVFYDASYAYISYTDVQINGNASVPTDTRYFTVSLWGYTEDITVDFLKSLMVSSEEIKGVEPYYTYSTSSEGGSSGSEGGSSVLSEVNTYNLFDKSNILRNYSVDNSGNIYAVSASYNLMVTNFMPIEEGQQVSITLNGQHVNYNKYFFTNNDLSNSRDNFLVRMDTTYAQAPKGAKFFVLRVTDVTDDLIDNLCVSTNGYLPYIEHTKTIVPSENIYLDLQSTSNQIKTWYADKIIDCLGDSITETGLYQRYVLTALRCKAVANHGIGGTRISGSSSTAMWQDVRINALDNNADVIFVLGGTNDRSNYVAGEVSKDNFDTNTFVGAYNTLLFKIYYKYGMITNVPSDKVSIVAGVVKSDTAKDIVIVLGTPPYNDVDEKVIAIGELVKKVSDLWGLPCADILNNSGINKINADYFFTDSDRIHPLEKGRERIARVIVGTLKENEPI